MCPRDKPGIDPKIRRSGFDRETCSQRAEVGQWRELAGQRVVCGRAPVCGGAGLVRHRAEAPAYKWKTLKSGEDLASLIPHDLFNDAMDTERAACADYGPSMLPKTWKERIEDALPEQNKQQFIKELPPEEQPGAMVKRQMLIRDLVVKNERKNIYDARTRAKLKRRRGR